MSGQRISDMDIVAALGTSGDYVPVVRSDANYRFDLAAGLTFTQAGTGAVARSAQDKSREVVSVKDFGAVGNNTADDTTAFNAAIAYLATQNGGDILVPNGTFKVTGKVAVGTNRICIVGAGKGGTRIVFAPTADGTCLEFGGGVGPSYNQGLRNLTIQSSDATYAKILLHLRDCSRFFLQNVDLTGTVSNGISVYLFGGAGGSIGLKLSGRDLSTFDHLTITAQRPIVIGPNANASIASDHCVFRDLYLVGSLGAGAHGTDYPLINIEKSPMSVSFPYSTDITNLEFTGSQAWVGGGYGLHWDDDTVTNVSASVLVENVRREQAQNITREIVYINRPNGPLQGLTIRNFYGGGTANAGEGVPGFYLRNITRVVLDRIEYTGLDVSKAPLDIDATVQSTTAKGFGTQSGISLTLAGQQKIAWGVGYPNAAIPSTFELATTSLTALRISEAFQSGPSIPVANNGTYTIGPTTLNGTIHISSSEGASAFFNLTGGGAPQEVSDLSGVYSVTSGTASSTNIYVSGGSYILQNKRGGSVSYRITGFGAGSAGF